MSKKQAALDYVLWYLATKVYDGMVKLPEHLIVGEVQLQNPSMHAINLFDDAQQIIQYSRLIEKEDGLAQFIVELDETSNLDMDRIPEYQPIHLLILDAVFITAKFTDYDWCWTSRVSKARGLRKWLIDLVGAVDLKTLSSKDLYLIGRFMLLPSTELPWLRSSLDESDIEGAEQPAKYILEAIKAGVYPWPTDIVAKLSN